MVGGAVGDALGYPVEFITDIEIFDRYGKNGITEYELNEDVALISDDTQMTLFTANGLLLGITRTILKNTKMPLHIYIDFCYKEWYMTQTNRFPLKLKSSNTWLINIPELFANRYNGATCVNGIRNPEMGTIENPLNNSKGCGGVMRVSPIGIFDFGDTKTIEEIDMLGADVSALTHGHELGYIPASALVHILQRIVHNEMTILEAVEDMIVTINKLFSNTKHINEFVSLMKKAVKLSKNNIDDLEAIEMLGEGWVAEETLAIAIYCSLKYFNNFEKAIISSVNHSGDSDSTGAVTGNIIGAYLGYENIPEKFTNNLELHNTILEIADDLHDIYELIESNNERWKEKYL